MEIDILTIVTDREAKVLRLINGLYPNKRKRTFKEIGAMPEFKVTAKKISQINRSALRKLWRRHVEIMSNETLIKELKRRGFKILIEDWSKFLYNPKDKVPLD